MEQRLGISREEAGSWPYPMAGVWDGRWCWLLDVPVQPGWRGRTQDRLARRLGFTVFTRTRHYWVSEDGYWMRSGIDYEWQSADSAPPELLQERARLALEWEVRERTRRLEWRPDSGRKAS